MMKKNLMATALLALLAAAPVARAHEVAYNVVTTWFEPQTQPKNTVFEGSFLFNEDTLTVTELKGRLSESMTGTTPDNMAWVDLTNQLVTFHDDALQGTFAAVFKNANTNTFTTLFGGDGWTPAAGIGAGGVYFGFPVPASNPGNAYALIFVPDAPTVALSPAQLGKLAYADCNPGGMMQASCMTGTSEGGYGLVGTMGGTPLSQTITLSAVPEPGAWALMLGGLALVGGLARKRKPQA